MRANQECHSRLERLVLGIVAAVQRWDHYRLFTWTIQLCIFIVCGTAAFYLRFDLAPPSRELDRLAWAIPVWLAMKAAAFSYCGLDRGWWKFVSVCDGARMVVGNALGSAAAAVVIAVITPDFPRSVYVIDFTLSLLATAGVRVLTRMACELADRQKASGPQKAVLLLGAGSVGAMLLRELHANPSLAYRVAGFIDDDVSKLGVEILGAKVLGPVRQLATCIADHHIQEVLITRPASSPAQMAEILETCHHANVRCRIIPSFGQLIDGNGLAHHVRDVAVEDLLGRQPVKLEAGQIRTKLEGQTVMVTGAGGSIGSELCRQIARFRPAAIIGYDIAENALFQLDREMMASFPWIRFHPEIGSVQNARRAMAVLDRYAPSVIYHAAAYKHVPLMEQHPFEAVENNVFGTHTIAKAAMAHGVADFVLISTDKAVRPTSVMGVTKRIAETVIDSLPPRPTRFVAVRFGNVLGSNGSAIPVFKEQIAAGGPVTVTHPEMCRYFMTIPEASQLVLQASTMGSAREVFVLDMGTPIRIVDVARNLILLSGLRPDKDIKIVFTGVRAGEKLYEELSTIDEHTVATTHEKIRAFRGVGFSEQELNAGLRVLRESCQEGDLRALILQFKDMVPEYNPSSYILKRLLPASRAVQQIAQGSLTPV